MQSSAKLDKTLSATSAFAQNQRQTQSQPKALASVPTNPVEEFATDIASVMKDLGMKAPTPRRPRMNTGASSTSDSGGVNNEEAVDDGSRAVREIDSFAGEIRDVLGSLGLSAVSGASACAKNEATPSTSGNANGSAGGRVGRTEAANQLLSPLSKLGI